MNQSHLEQKFAAYWDTLYPDVDLHTEQTIIPNRKFRFDFCHYPSKTAIEINGGSFNPKVRMGHASTNGLKRDSEKTLLAAVEGWLVIPLTSLDVEDYDKLQLVKRVIDLRSK